MKKLLTGIMALSILLSATACDSGSSATGSFSQHPVAVDENGEVDMDVALSYQTDVDALIEELEAQPVDGSKPVSKNANEETVKLFNFLKENYGKKIIAGQQMFDSAQYEDILYYTQTGDLPAIKGFDMIFSTGNQAENDYQIEEAIKWHTQQNGIVAFCWHWKVPMDIDVEDSTAIVFYSDEIKNFSLENAVTPGTKEYEVVIKDIDTVALQLQKLEAAGVPVIWRPLHEANGQWFWWGQSREGFEKQLYQKLWYMVFDRLENYHKLTNLIWVWNGQNSATAVNPNTYDIAGMDIYPNSEDHSAQVTQYKTLAKIMDESKMATISECGYIPDDAEVFAENSEAKWLYFMPWYGDFVCNATSSGMIITELGGTPTVNENRISADMLKKIYASENVITLSELPDWDGTEKYIPEHIRLWRFNNLNKEIAQSKLTGYLDESPEE